MVGINCDPTTVGQVNSTASTTNNHHTNTTKRRVLGTPMTGQVRQSAPPGLVKSKPKSSQEGCSGDQAKMLTGVHLTCPRLPSATNEGPSLIPIQAARCWNGIPASPSRLKTVLVLVCLRQALEFMKRACRGFCTLNKKSVTRVRLH